MSRGDINISANFNLAVSKPLDGKGVAGTLAEMYATPFAYPGLICYCLQDATLYVLDAEPATTPANWREVGSGTITAIPPHTHEIADVNLLQQELDSKLPLTGGTITGDLSVQGNFTVSGTVTQVNTTELTVSDNIIEVNSNQTGTPPATLEGGLRVNRGSLPAYLFVFREADSTFRIGEAGDLQAVATREDSPAPASIAVWDAAQNRYTGITGTSGQIVRWGSTGPEFFTPSYLTSLPAHGHSISEVANLQTALDGKSAVGHTHPIADITGLQTALNGKAAVGHTHSIADITGLQTELNNLASASTTFWQESTTAPGIYYANRVAVGHSNPRYKLDVIENRAGQWAAWIENASNIGNGMRITASAASDAELFEVWAGTNLAYRQRGDGSVNIRTRTPALVGNHPWEVDNDQESTFLRYRRDNALEMVQQGGNLPSVPADGLVIGARTFNSKVCLLTRNGAGEEIRLFKSSTTVASPAGGTTQDAQARAAIIAILSHLDLMNLLDVNYGGGGGPGPI